MLRRSNPTIYAKDGSFNHYGTVKADRSQSSSRELLYTPAEGPRENETLGFSFTGTIHVALHLRYGQLRRVH